ncbi:MAG: ABC transporter substrate-binding protein [Pseudomonadota bacterium]
MTLFKRLSAGALAAAISVFALASSAQAKTEVLTDVLGREVSVELPAKKVLLGFYYTDYMAIGGVEAFENVVGFSKDVWTVWTPKSWELFVKKLPQLDEIADVGEVEAGTFSVEKLLSLKPEVVILADWQFQALGPDADRIEKAGIPIVVVDYNAQTIERHVNTTLLLGKISGAEERATQLANEYQANAEMIAKRISDDGRPRPRAYIEFGKKGPKEPSFTYGKNMWGALVTLAGGDNIAAPYVDWWGLMNPEQVLAAKPQAIFISGRETELNKNDEALVMGVDIPKQEALRRLKGFETRTGWSELPAIKNQNLFGLYQGASRTLADQAMIQYMAKAMYPDLFEDLDPNGTYLDFHKKYLPVVPEGTFVLSVKD